MTRVFQHLRRLTVSPVLSIYQWWYGRALSLWFPRASFVRRLQPSIAALHLRDKTLDLDALQLALLHAYDELTQLLNTVDVSLVQTTLHEIIHKLEPVHATMPAPATPPSWGTPLHRTDFNSAAGVASAVISGTLYATLVQYAKTRRMLPTDAQEYLVQHHPLWVIEHPYGFQQDIADRQFNNLVLTARQIHELYDSAAERRQALADWAQQKTTGTQDLPADLA